MEGEAATMEVEGEATMEEVEVEAEPMRPEPIVSTSSLFPLSTSLPSAATTSASQWLSNSSFTVDTATIKNAVSSIHSRQKESEPESDDDIEREREGNVTARASYEPIESSGSERDSSRERRRKKKRKKRSSREKRDVIADLGARKTGVRAWASSDYKPAKEYYIDSHGDRDNLAFGSLYRMDVARYKPYNQDRYLSIRGQYRRKDSLFEKDADVDALDNKLKSAGRYWSPKFSALERQKTYKHLRVNAPEMSTWILPGDFIPLSESETSHKQVDGNFSGMRTMIEESWEDEVLRKTREFNKMTREHPHDERTWLEFAEFQDKVSSRQPQKGVRLQTLEKKISILEKATELNPDNEELLLSLLKAYQSRDNSDVLIGRWEKILLQNSSSCKLWREFLRIVQGEFSRFKVTELRKIYANAIQALSSACSKQSRQLRQNGETPDAAVIQLELGLVDIFVSICRFEWQAGYKELATGLFQAEVEFSLFCPALVLSEHSKQRLFEHFWNSEAARVGEAGALGWSGWLEKEEEERQRAISEDNSSDDDKGGWTGWSEPISKSASKYDEEIPSAVTEDFLEEPELDGEPETEDVNQEDDTEALMKTLGIDIDSGANAEVNDASTWVRWSEEESSRDNSQWMPVRAKSAGVSQSDGKPDKDEDEQFLSVIMYEDVCEYLFSLSSEEARLSLVAQFIDLFGGRISHRICTNSSSWMEKLLSLEAFPDSLSLYLRSIYDVFDKAQTSSYGCNMEDLLASKNEIPSRSNMMSFIRNATLLCLKAFPRNYIVEQAALIAEEQSVTESSSNHSQTPCRALAKSLLKNDRKDVLLCGVYAQREAASGNMDHARKVFDMALSSIEVLSLDLQSNAPLLYFWYAEMELANKSVPIDEESASRALHILSSFGSGIAYSTFKCRPSSVQLLRAHQGFKERCKEVRSAWTRGAIDDQSLAIICSAALFEELTAGCGAALEVIHQAFMAVLPERRSKSYHLETLYNFHLRMLQRHHKQLTLSKVWDSIEEGLHMYPFNPEIFNIMVDIGNIYATPNKLRWSFDDLCNRRPSVIVWLFALAYDMAREKSQHRIHGLFERALANDKLRTSVLLWRCYIAYEMDVAQNPSSARRIFFRAIHACPWSKKLWLDGFLKLNSILTAKELSDLQEVMRDKELNLRTDIYEILLQDEVVS